MLRYKQIVLHHYDNGDYDTLFSLYIEGITTFMRARFEPFMERLMERFRGKRVLLFSSATTARNTTPPITGISARWPKASSAFRCCSTARTSSPAFTGSACAAWTSRRPSPRAWASRRPDWTACHCGSRCSARRARPGAAAFSQAYVSDTAAFVDFQQRLLRDGHTTGSLPHVRYAGPCTTATCGCAGRTMNTP